MLTSLLKLHLCIHLRLRSLNRLKPNIIQNLQITQPDWTKRRLFQWLLQSRVRTFSQGAEFNTGYILSQRERENCLSVYFHPNNSRLSIPSGSPVSNNLGRHTPVPLFLSWMLFSRTILRYLAVLVVCIGV